jgi:hypothetical protein
MRVMPGGVVNVRVRLPTKDQTGSPKDHFHRNGDGRFNAPKVRDVSAVNDQAPVV